MKKEYTAGGRKRIVPLMTLLFIAVMCILTGVTSYAKEEEVNNNRILFISSYSLSRDTVQLEIEGIQSAQPDDFIHTFLLLPGISETVILQVQHRRR